MNANNTLLFARCNEWNCADDSGVSRSMNLLSHDLTKWFSAFMDMHLLEDENVLSRNSDQHGFYSKNFLKSLLTRWSIGKRYSDHICFSRGSQEWMVNVLEDDHGWSGNMWLRSTSLIPYWFVRFLCFEQARHKFLVGVYLSLFGFISCCDDQILGGGVGPHGSLCHADRVPPHIRSGHLWPPGNSCLSARD